MDFQEIIKNAKELVTEDMSKALKFIVPQIKPESSSFDELIHIEGRLNHIEREFNKGIISSQEKDLILNQIRKGLIQTINSLLENNLINKEQMLDTPQTLNFQNLLEKLRISIAEIEKLKSENNLYKQHSKRQKLKIIVQCEPEIKENPNNYTCQCMILDDETGISIEKEIPLRREPGGIVVTIHDFNPSDYVQIRINGEKQVWESEYFSPQFFPQILKLI
ncbi:MAG: hypothetical protein IPM42_16870 [Saprospiraceae bacterium]|nr:hypothetical protein [Saprospiraceae bacterium]